MGEPKGSPTPPVFHIDYGSLGSLTPPPFHIEGTEYPHFLLRLYSV